MSIHSPNRWPSFSPLQPKEPVAGKFCIDPSPVNLFSQKVAFSWPEFRPQSPVFAGPKVDLPQRHVYARPLQAMDPCAYSEHGPIYGGCAQPKPGISCNPFAGWPGSGKKY